MSDILTGAARTRITAGLVLLGFAASGVVVQPAPVAASTLVTTTYTYSGAIDTFTVPPGVSSITVTLKGGQGGRGGHDSHGAPIPGGYQGVVTGVIEVTPGEMITVAVGSGGGTGNSSQTSAPGGYAGLNPRSEYSGARGGTAGPEGSSGGGGGSGAASVLQIGSDRDRGRRSRWQRRQRSVLSHRRASRRRVARTAIGHHIVAHHRAARCEHVDHVQRRFPLRRWGVRRRWRWRRRRRARCRAVRRRLRHGVLRFRRLPRERTRPRGSPD